jgi:hypothetical protein
MRKLDGEWEVSMPNDSPRPSYLETKILVGSGGASESTLL